MKTLSQLNMAEHPPVSFKNVLLEKFSQQITQVKLGMHISEKKLFVDPEERVIFKPRWHYQVRWTLTNKGLRRTNEG